jgi:hypothetical protein
MPRSIRCGIVQKARWGNDARDADDAGPSLDPRMTRAEQELKVAVVACEHVLNDRKRAERGVVGVHRRRRRDVTERELAQSLFSQVLELTENARSSIDLLRLPTAVEIVALNSHATRSSRRGGHSMHPSAAA